MDNFRLLLSPGCIRKYIDLIKGEVRYLEPVRSLCFLWYQSRERNSTIGHQFPYRMRCYFFRLNSRWLILIWFTYKTLQYFFSDYFPFKSVFLWRFSWNWPLSASNWSDERHNGFSGRLYRVITISYFADKSLNYGSSGNKWVFPLDVPELIAVQYGAVFTPRLTFITAIIAIHEFERTDCSTALAEFNSFMLLSHVKRRLKKSSLL